MDCIEYEGARFRYGYGQLPRPLGGTRYAHRAVMIEHHVPIAGMIVRHRCDNPPCINPEHLTVGTQADNVRDMMERGGHRGSNGPYKVTPEVRERVLAMDGPCRKVASEIGLSPSTIQRIRRNA